MKKLLTLILLTALLTAALPGCTLNKQDGEAAGKLRIVTTVFPLYDFARAVAGGLADVTMLIDPGAEVHTFDPTTEDIIKIRECDVFIYIGGENDMWVDTVLEPLDTSGKTVVRLMDAVTPVEEETVEGMQAEKNEAREEHGKIGYDEHIWTSPKNAILMVSAIADALGKADSANAKIYVQNAQSYTEQIAQVDDQIQPIAENASSKLIVVADRFPFRYLADEFGFSYCAAFAGCSSETEVSAGTLSYLIDKVKENGIGYVYYIEFSNRQVAEAVSEQTGADMLLLHSCHNVTKEEFDTGVTYLSLMQQNAANLKKGLE